MTLKNDLNSLSPYIVISCVLIALFAILFKGQSNTQVNPYKESTCTMNDPICFKMQRLTIVHINERSHEVTLVDEYGADVGTYFIGDPDFWNLKPETFMDYKFSVRYKFFNGTTNMIQGVKFIEK